MIYPALTYLEEIGHAGVTQEGNRKLYAITVSGQAHLEANRPTVTAILAALARIGGRMAEMREAYQGVQDVDPRASDELHRARHGLKHALMAKMGCTGSEARRIAKILDEAAAAILGERL
jgi:DNA-binding PadR family transcriptional regulator